MSSWGETRCPHPSLLAQCAGGDRGKLGGQVRAEPCPHSLRAKGAFSPALISCQRIPGSKDGDRSAHRAHICLCITPLARHSEPFHSLEYLSASFCVRRWVLTVETRVLNSSMKTVKVSPSALGHAPAALRACQCQVLCQIAIGVGTGVRGVAAWPWGSS